MSTSQTPDERSASSSSSASSSFHIQVFNGGFRRLGEEALSGAEIHIRSHLSVEGLTLYKGAAVHNTHSEFPHIRAERSWMRQGGLAKSRMRLYKGMIKGGCCMLLDDDSLAALLEAGVHLEEFIPRSAERVRAFIRCQDGDPSALTIPTIQREIDSLKEHIEAAWGVTGLAHNILTWTDEHVHPSSSFWEVRFNMPLEVCQVRGFHDFARTQLTGSAILACMNRDASLTGTGAQLPQCADTSEPFEESALWYMHDDFDACDDGGDDDEEGAPVRPEVPDAEHLKDYIWQDFCKAFVGSDAVDLDVELDLEGGGGTTQLYYPTRVPNVVRARSSLFKCIFGHPALLELDMVKMRISFKCPFGCVPTEYTLKHLRMAAGASKGNQVLRDRSETAIALFSKLFGRDAKVAEMLERHAMVGDTVYSRIPDSACLHLETEKITTGAYRSQLYFYDETRVVKDKGKDGEGDGEKERRSCGVRPSDKLFRMEFQTHPAKTIARRTFFHPMNFVEMREEEERLGHDPSRFRTEKGELNTFTFPDCMRVLEEDIAAEDIEAGEMVWQTWAESFSEEDFSLFLGWLTHLCKHGRTRVMCAFMAAEGSGKSRVMGSVQNFFAPHIVSAGRDEVVAEQFNAHVANATLVVVDDIQKVPRHILYGVTTGESISVRKMHTDRYEAPLYTSVIGSFNTHDNPLPISETGEKQRRYLVLEFLDTHLGDGTFWSVFMDNANNPRAQRWIIGELLKREDDFKPGQAVETDALRDLKRRVVPSVQWLGDALFYRRYLMSPSDTDDLPWAEGKSVFIPNVTKMEVYRWYSNRAECYGNVTRSHFYALLDKVFGTKVGKEGELVGVCFDTWASCAERYLELYTHEGLKILRAGSLEGTARRQRERRHKKKRKEKRRGEGREKRTREGEEVPE